MNSFFSLAECLNCAMNLEEIWLAHLRLIVDKEAQADGGRLRAGYRAVASRVGKKEEYIYQLYQGKLNAKGLPRAVSLEFSKALDRHYAEGRAPGWINQPPLEGNVAREADKDAGAAAAVAPIATWPFKAVSYRRFMTLPSEARSEIDGYLESMVLTWERKAEKLTASRKRR